MAASASGHFGFPIFSKIDRALALINGCVKYEFDTRIGVAVMSNTPPGLKMKGINKDLGLGPQANTHMMFSGYSYPYGRL